MIEDRAHRQLNMDILMPTYNAPAETTQKAALTDEPEFYRILNAIKYERDMLTDARNILSQLRNKIIGPPSPPPSEDAFSGLVSKNAGLVTPVLPFVAELDNVRSDILRVRAQIFDDLVELDKHF